MLHVLRPNREGNLTMPRWLAYLVGALVILLIVVVLVHYFSVSVH